MSEFVVTRIFDASREKIWSAFTEKESLVKWWGPKGFPIEVLKLEIKPGGLFHYSMEVPGGHKLYGRFVYGEVNAPEKLTFINSFSDQNGEILRNSWNPNWPLEVSNVMTLTEKGGKTELTLKGSPLNASEAENKTFEEGASSMEQGFKGTFDQLDEFLGV